MPRPPAVSGVRWTGPEWRTWLLRRRSVSDCAGTLRRTTGPRRRSLADACVANLRPVTAVAVKCDGAFGSPVINHHRYWRFNRNDSARGICFIFTDYSECAALTAWAPGVSP